MKKYNEAEFIPRFKDGNKVKIKATGQQGIIIKNEGIDNPQTGTISPTECYLVRIDKDSCRRCHENELELGSPES
jgi:hypothetical protein